MRRETGVGVHGQEQSNESIYLDEEGMSKVQWPSKKVGRLVAVKTTEREVCDSNSRSRVSFVREVEILRVSHDCGVNFCAVAQCIASSAAHLTSVNHLLCTLLQHAVLPLSRARVREWW